MNLKGNMQLRVAQEGNVKTLFEHLNEDASVYFIVEEADMDFCLEEVSKNTELSATDDFCIVSTKGPENFLNIPNLTNLVCLDSIEDEMDVESVMVGMLNTVMSDFQQMVSGDNEASMRILKKFVNSNSPYWRNIFGKAPQFKERLAKFVDSLSDPVNKEIAEGRAMLNENAQELLAEKDSLIATATEKMQKLEAENQKKQALIAELEAKISGLEEQVSGQDDGVANEVVEALRAELEEIKKTENALTQSLAEKDNALSEKDKALSEKDYALSEKDNALSEKDNDLNEKINLINELQAKLGEVQKELEGAGSEDAEALNELQTKYDEAVKLGEQLEAEKKDLQEGKEKLESELEQLKSQLENSSDDAELETLTQRVSELEGILQETKVSREDDANKITELEKDLQEAQSLRAEDANKIMELEEERDSLKAQVSEMENAEASAKENTEEIEKLNAKIKSLEEASEATEEIKKQLEEKESEIEELKNKMSSLEESGADTEEVKKQLEVKDGVIKSLKEKLSANEELLKNVSVGGSVNIDELAEKEREIMNLNAIISEMKKKENGGDTNPFEQNIIDTSFGKKLDKEDLLQTIKNLEAKLAKKDALIEELNKQIANLND